MNREKHAIFNIVWISLIAISVAFTAVVTSGIFREFSHAGLEGRHFYEYYGVFLPLLWFLFLMLTHVCLLGTRRVGQVWWWVCIGTLAGYVSGALSISSIELFPPGGWDLLIRQSHHATDWLLRAAYPVVSLNWLVGLIVGFVSFHVHQSFYGRRQVSKRNS